MITEANYSRLTMKSLTTGLPTGTREKLAAKLNLTYAQVDNCFSGKCYNERVIKALAKMKSKTVAA